LPLSIHPGFDDEINPGGWLSRPGRLFAQSLLAFRVDNDNVPELGQDDRLSKAHARISFVSYKSIHPNGPILAACTQTALHGDLETQPPDSKRAPPFRQFKRFTLPETQ
jgi:hypothetical protein